MMFPGEKKTRQSVNKNAAGEGKRGWGKKRGYETSFALRLGHQAPMSPWGTGFPVTRIPHHARGEKQRRNDTFFENRVSGW